MSRVLARRARAARRCGWCTPYDSPRKCARYCGDGHLIDEWEANPR